MDRAWGTAEHGAAKSRTQLTVSLQSAEKFLIALLNASL